MNTAIPHYSDWLGKSESKPDEISARAANGLAATLDRTNIAFKSGDELPPLWHWLFFQKMARYSELAPDGHPFKGGFLPPIKLPRRMWAGSRVTFHRPLIIGEKAQKQSVIKNIQCKQGRSGQLVFVCIEHKLSGSQGLAITEEQDLVYRDTPVEHAVAPKVLAAPQRHNYSLAVSPDPVLLFRYSALTENSHRIHYDRDYAVNTEGYPGLVVHGPLLATYLLELLTRQFPAATVRQFDFKAISPVFESGAFSVCGLTPETTGKCELWIQNEAGALCIKGTAIIA